jgi:hypothetical protein|tara:strand:- start:1745 stop:3193 length:1449 start_codon:yes stop_codon:yes gene_type:complete
MGFGRDFFGAATKALPQGVQLGVQGIENARKRKEDARDEKIFQMKLEDDKVNIFIKALAKENDPNTTNNLIDQWRDQELSQREEEMTKGIMTFNSHQLKKFDEYNDIIKNASKGNGKNSFAEGAQAQMGRKALFRANKIEPPAEYTFWDRYFGLTDHVLNAKNVDRLKVAGEKAAREVFETNVNRIQSEIASFADFMKGKDLKNLTPSGQEAADAFTGSVESHARSFLATIKDKDKREAVMDLFKQTAGDFIDFEKIKKKEVEEEAYAKAKGTASGKLTSQTQADIIKAQQGKSPFDISTDLSKRFVKMSGQFIKIRDSFARIRASISDEPSPAGDLSLIFNYMKMLDPASVVRESEFATAENAGGVDDKTRGLYNKIVGKGRLSADQRKDFVGRAKKLMEGQKKQQGVRKSEFIRLANKFGVKPDTVIIELRDPDLHPEITVTLSDEQQSKVDAIKEPIEKAKFLKSQGFKREDIKNLLGI